MFRASRLSPVVFALLLAAPVARADGFAIDLEVRAGKAKKTAHAETVAPGVKPKARGVLEAKAGVPLSVRWTLSNPGKAPVKDVTVHFFAVKEEAAGQKAVPKLDKGVVAETALSMDFKPRDKNEGDLTFTIDKPGAYLLRVEALGKEGAVSFAALDVVVR